MRLQYPIDLLVNVLRVLNLRARRSELAQRFPRFVTRIPYRRGQVCHGLPRDMRFLVIVLDLHVDNVDRLIEIAPSGQKI